MQTLILYSTSACHLCELALQIIEPALEREQAKSLALRVVDIADDDSLMETYGIRIPVVQLEGAATDLGWPFDAIEFDAYLRSVTA